MKKQNDNGKHMLFSRKIQILVMILGLAISGVLIWFTFHSTQVYRQLLDATNDYIRLHDAADGLMDASDYLTEMAQRFADKGDRTYMDSYFQEAVSNQRRENALSTLESYPDCEEALEDLQNALNESIKLMAREYYSMKLVVDVKGYADYPSELHSVELKPEDAALSADEKMDLAQSMVLDEEYYQQKDLIRSNMDKAVADITDVLRENQAEAQEILNRDMTIMRSIILLQTILFVVLIVLTLRSGSRKTKTE